MSDQTERATALRSSGEAADTTFPSTPPGGVQPCPYRNKTWIDVEILDQDGVPITGIRYRLEAPDGRVVEGILDAHGLAGIEGIDPGECKLILTDTPVGPAELVE